MSLSRRGRQCRTRARAPGRGVLCEGYKEYGDTSTFLRASKLLELGTAKLGSLRFEQRDRVAPGVALHRRAKRRHLGSLFGALLLFSKVRSVTDGSASSGTPCTHSSLRKPRRKTLTSSSSANISIVYMSSLLSRGNTVQNSSCKTLYVGFQARQYAPSDSCKIC